MKTVSPFLLILMLLMAACTVPTATDFETANRPLAEDEFIVIWRFPHKAERWEVTDTTEAYALELEQAMKPLFQQLFPRIFADAKTGKVIIREEDDVANLDEAAIEDLPAKMRDAFSGSWQNIEPYMGVFHITQRRQESAKGFKGLPLELMIIAKDPENKMPERYLGSVNFSELTALDYQIEVEGQKYSLIDYVEQVMKYAYPIHYMNNEMANGLYTLEQAFETKEIVLQGEFASIEWLGGQPNLTDKRSVKMEVAQLSQFAGTYLVKPAEGSSLTQGDEEISVLVRVAEDHLQTEWSNQGPYHSFLMFPSSESAFFTVYNTQIRFEENDIGLLEMVIQEEDGPEIRGTQKR